MRLNKKPLWSSLLLVLVTYAVFGWSIAAYSHSLMNLLLGAVYVLLVAFALTAPLMSMRRLFSGVLSSDNMTLVSIIILAFFSVVVLTWIQISLRVLLLVAALGLARLDMQVLGYKQSSAFILLAVFSLSGYGLGLLLYQIF